MSHFVTQVNGKIRQDLVSKPIDPKMDQAADLVIEKPGASSSLGAKANGNWARKDYQKWDRFHPISSIRNGVVGLTPVDHATTFERPEG